jgi:DNA polymerase III epsilon subunit-like protein
MGTSEVGIINTTICVLDIETTGFEPGPAEIIELFILKVEENNIIEEFYSLFKPKSSITNSHIHGIDNKSVINSPLFSDKISEILDFIDGTTLIGHNIDNFDLKFLNYFLEQEITNKTIDTLNISRSKLGNKVKNHKLKTLAEYFNVVTPTHTARDDVMTTFEVYKKLSSIQ